MLSQARVNELQGRFAGELTTTIAKKRVRNWHCNLSEMLVGEYLITPITSVKMLDSEGYWMSNSCQEYLSQCAELTYCIFSVRSRSGERLATLGLTKNREAWYFDQCYGPSNSEVLEESLEYLDEEGELQTEWFPTEMYYVAQEVSRLMNSANGSH